MPRLALSLALAATLATALAACTSAGAFLDDARRRDALAVDEEFAPPDPAASDPAAPASAARDTGPAWIVVTGGQVAGRAEDHDAAAAAHPAVDGHRFVFRARDLTPPVVSLAYLPADGGVAGQGLATALGVDVTEGATGDVTLRHGLATARLRLDQGRALELELSAPGSTEPTRLRVAFDPSFDGALLLPAAAARGLGLAAHELPGRATVRVALGRPFEALRALAQVRIPALEAEGRVEALSPAPSAR